ncbi:MAG: (2Fe-2S)-binding protein [Gammaproteobacteria bacterium]
MKSICLKINGEKSRVDVRAHWSLAYAIREKVGLTGTKTCCEMGTCGSCTVLLDGLPVFSCLKMAVDAEDQEITTIEGLERNGKLHPLQQAFIEDHGMQCGICTPGMIIAAKALLDENANPTEREVREAIGGHLCRCGTYTRIVKSILHAAEIARNS